MGKTARTGGATIYIGIDPALLVTGALDVKALSCSHSYLSVSLRESVKGKPGGQAGERKPGGQAGEGKSGGQAGKRKSGGQAGKAKSGGQAGERKPRRQAGGEPLTQLKTEKLLSGTGRVLDCGDGAGHDGVEDSGGPCSQGGSGF
jgi:hypothetical protein